MLCLYFISSALHCLFLGEHEDPCVWFSLALPVLMVSCTTRYFKKHLKEFAAVQGRWLSTDAEIDHGQMRKTCQKHMFSLLSCPCYFRESADIHHRQHLHTSCPTYCHLIGQLLYRHNIYKLLNRMNSQIVQFVDKEF